MSQLALDLDSYLVQERLSRKARCIRIEVRAGGEVHLVIPSWASRAQAHAFLRERADWVRRKRVEARLRAAPAPSAAPALRWDGSDRIPLRGVDVPLRLAAVSGRGASARFDEGVTLLVPVGWLGQPQRLETALKKALMEEARRGAVLLLDQEAARLGVHHSVLSMRDPRSLWGSCGANGRIMLSWRLLLAPPPVLRYVVIHELCHLRYRSHGPRFWGLVERQMPDYAVHRRWLREQGSRLHWTLGHTK